MADRIRKIVIVGGGSAGWLTAGLIAAKHKKAGDAGIDVTVIEAPDIPIIGVGEGTWPTMRTTLRTIGVKETDFIRECHASFKQGSKFSRWHQDKADSFYYHPFDLPEGFSEANVAELWLANRNGRSFSEQVCPQEALCEQHLAPKQATSPEYGGFSNYGYHLDAGAFSGFLRDHCTSKLNVKLVADKMIGLAAHENGDIKAVTTENSGSISGDLFIDCTGFRALLLGEHFGVGLKSRADILFPDTALAVQVPYMEGAHVQSSTVATAQPAGWIWDVSLSTRRGIGHVYSSAHMNEEQATECIRQYLGLNEGEFAKLSLRKLAIGSGHRETFWKRNCIAIGLSAGFFEPLEASALMLIETMAGRVADHMPATRSAMDIVAKRFNARVHEDWERILHFLKLHYCLSDRPEAFWQDNRDPGSIPDRLKEDLNLWAHQAPWLEEMDAPQQVFPPASYQYVLYGMGFQTSVSGSGMPPELQAFAAAKFDTVARSTARLATMLPTNRALLDILNG